MSVIYDLKQSNYKSKYKDFEFYFSSNFYKSKFDQGLKEYQHKIIIRLMSKIKISESFLLKFRIDILLAIAYYHQIEKRGSRFEQK